MDKDVKALCALIEKVVMNDEGSWTDKRDAIRTECDKDALVEFLAWFDEDEEDDE